MAFGLRGTAASLSKIWQEKRGGVDRARTGDIGIFSAALSQLSYNPKR
jgi:hypothetical protein